MIRYRYPGKEWTEVDADRYEQEDRAVQCPNFGVYIVEMSWTIFWFCVDRPNWYTSTIRRTGNQKIKRKFWIDLLDPKFSLPTLFFNRSGRYNSDFGTEIVTSVNTQYNTPDGYGYPFNTTREENNKYSTELESGRPDCGEKSSSNYVIDFNSISIDRVYPEQEPEKSCFGCLTTFYKNDFVVLQLDNDKCPEIEETESECPDNTCKVDCKNHYCCYGSDGISIFAYEK